MLSNKHMKVFVPVIIVVLLYSCKTEEIILHGDIKGKVTETSTGEPISGATVKLDQINDSTLTGNWGDYLLKNIIPGEYNIQVTKPGYLTGKNNAAIGPEQTLEINISLDGQPKPEISDTHLDYGFDTTSLSFNIKNSGKGKMYYILVSNRDWITVSPSTGEVASETDIVTVNVNRIGLPGNTFKELIEVFFVGGQDIIKDTVGVFLNGVMDRDLNYYNIVTIGTQTWMSENLNVGSQINSIVFPSDNGIIEKYCLNNSVSLCKTYGGLYQWKEMMQYSESDNANIGSTQGICPVGWHIPTDKEWQTLYDYIGPEINAVRKLKETGTAHWNIESGATNETGFTALPAGVIQADSWTPPYGRHFGSSGIEAIWWSSTIIDPLPGMRNSSYWKISSYNYFVKGGSNEFSCYSVRCIKNQ